MANLDLKAFSAPRDTVTLPSGDTVELRHRDELDIVQLAQLEQSQKEWEFSFSQLSDGVRSPEALSAVDEATLSFMSLIFDDMPIEKARAIPLNLRMRIAEFWATREKELDAKGPNLGN